MKDSFLFEHVRRKDDIHSETGSTSGKINSEESKENGNQPPERSNSMNNFNFTQGLENLAISSQSSVVSDSASEYSEDLNSAGISPIGQPRKFQRSQFFKL